MLKNVFACPENSSLTYGSLKVTGQLVLPALIPRLIYNNEARIYARSNYALSIKTSFFLSKSLIKSSSEL
jgi:hypothetical protein